MSSPLEAELECSTLARWAPQTSVLDLCGIGDTLTEAYVQALRDYEQARRDGRTEDAVVLRDDVRALVGLLAELRGELDYRRELYLLTERQWPLPLRP